MTPTGPFTILEGANQTRGANSMSAQKPWDRVTQAEKVEHLHDSLLNLQRAHDALAAMASLDRTSLKKLGAEVADLRKRLDQANLPPPALRLLGPQVRPPFFERF